MICEKREKPITDTEPRVDVKEVSESAVKRYHPACAAAALAPQVVASTTAPNGSSQEG